MSLADYLAKNYLTADPPADKKSKKRKRKAAKNNAAGLIIADDDISGWNTNTAENDDDDAPMIGTQFLNYTPPSLLQYPPRNCYSTSPANPPPL
jgi:pre-mRNA-splicing factor CWC26